MCRNMLFKEPSIWPSAEVSAGHGADRPVTSIRGYSWSGDWEPIAMVPFSLGLGFRV